MAENEGILPIVQLLNYPDLKVKANALVVLYKIAKAGNGS